VDAISADSDVYADKLWREVPPLSELKGYSLLCVDEADLYLPQRRAAGRSEVLTELLRRGRHYGLTLVLATQRPSALAYDAWSLADSAFIFSLTSEVDLRRAAELDSVIAEHKDAISRLQPGECYHWRAHESDRVQLTRINAP
jgi:DNA helicase HerA-like ATPase